MTELIIPSHSVICYCCLIAMDASSPPPPSPNLLEKDNFVQFCKDLGARLKKKKKNQIKIQQIIITLKSKYNLKVSSCYLKVFTVVNNTVRMHNAVICDIITLTYCKHEVFLWWKSL